MVPAIRAIVGELDVYERLLLKWQPKINLIGRATLTQVWARHFADSGQLSDLAPLERRWADLGSGAGFPGMVLALLQGNRSGCEMHLIESDARKAAFLREVSRETGAKAIIHNARCEDVLGDIQPEIICSRAMAHLHALLDYAKPFVDKGGMALFMKGRDVASELTEVSIPSNFSINLIPSRIDPASSIVQVKTV